MQDNTPIRWAKSPEILRSYQRDLECKQFFRFALVEFLESIMNYKKVREYQMELRSLADFIYLWMTTLRGRQTLGEEYCSIIPAYGRNGEFPSPLRRLAYVLGSVFLPYYV